MTRFYLVLIGLVFAHPAFSQFTEQWHKTINSVGDYSDRFTCVASDPDGNIYLGGSTVNTNESLNFLVSKFNSNGTLLWTKTWNGTGNGPDEANDIVYANGNVYVTGYLNSSGAGNDFFTLALTANGDSIWGALYNDPTYFQYEQANAIAVDSNGDVLVCGESDRDQTNITNDDFLTIKYSATGNQLWVQRFNDLGNGTDRAVAVVTDASNNVYVCGRSDNGADDDYAILKYNPAGNVQWMQFVDNGGIDRATGMGIDGSGNILVTGRSDNGNDDDFLTVKFNSSGLQVWSVSFDFVEDDRADYIDVNPDGSFVVAGRSDGNPTIALNYNYRVVSYSASGTQTWTSSFDGAAANDDIVRGLDMDANGNVLVTGYSDLDAGAPIRNQIVSILYASNGATLWTQNHAAPAPHEAQSNGCLIHNSNKSIVAAQMENSVGQRNAYVVQYDATGNPIESTWNGIGDNGDNIRDLFVDNSNNIIITGYSVYKDNDRDMFVAKLNASGDTLWTRHQSGTLFGSDDESNALAVDASGNIVISGYIKNSGTSSDVVIHKYNSSGTLLWTSLFNGIANESDRSFDMQMSSSGNIYITGKTDINSSPVITNDEIFTACYNASGALVWSNTYAGGAGIDRGRFVRISGDGSIYVVGKIDNNGNDDLIVLKYSNAGSLIWEYTFDGPLGHESAKDAYLDANNQLYITATSETSLNSGISNILTLVLDNNAGIIWQDNFDSGSAQTDIPEAILVDGTGRTYIVGQKDSDASESVNNDCLILCYSSAGALQWANSYDDANNLDDAGDDLTTDNLGNILLTYHSNTGTSTDLDYSMITLALEPATGNTLQSTEFDISDSLDVGNVIKSVGGNVYLGGSSWSASGQRDMLIVKYGLIVGINEVTTADLMVYPNPVSDNLNFTSSIFGQGVTAIISDMNGKAVETFQVSSRQNQINVSALPTGIYNLNIIHYNQKIQTNFIKATNK